MSSHEVAETIRTLLQAEASQSEPAQPTWDQIAAIASLLADKARDTSRASQKRPVRSRNGCATCKKRKKKCPEVYENGRCLRCLDADMECVRGESSTKRRRSTKQSSPESPLQETSTSTQNPLPSIETVFHNVDLSSGQPAAAAGLSETSDNGFEFPDFLTGSGILLEPEVLDTQGFLTHETTWPAEQDEALLADFYHDIVIRAWSATLSEQSYQSMVTYCRATSKSSEPLRASRNAVSAAFIHRLRTWQGSRTASVLKRSPLPNKYHHLQLDSLHMFNDAVRLIQATPKATNASPDLDVQLWSIVNLMTAALACHGGNAVVQCHTLRDELVESAFGHSPTPNLNTVSNVASFALRCFIMDDLSRSIAERKPTKFTFLEPDVESFSETNYFGLPSTLAWLVASASNLCASVTASQGISPALRQQALFLHGRLIAWHPRPLATTPTEATPLYGPELSVQQELWRLTALILIDKIAFGHNVQSLAFRQRTSQAIALLKCVSVLSEERSKRRGAVLDFWAEYYAAPAFVVGCCVIDQDERDFIRTFISELGAEVFLNGLSAVLHAVWAASDVLGYWVDWVNLADKEILSVSFM